MSHDRRSFLARLAGAIAGLIAGKHVVAKPKTGTVMLGSDFTLEADGRPVTNMNAIREPLAYSEPGSMGWTIKSDGKTHLRAWIDGIELRDCAEIEFDGRWRFIANDPKRRIERYGRARCFMYAESLAPNWVSASFWGVDDLRPECVYAGWIRVVNLIPTDYATG